MSDMSIDKSRCSTPKEMSANMLSKKSLDFELIQGSNSFTNLKNNSLNNTSQLKSNHNRSSI